MPRQFGLKAKNVVPLVRTVRLFDVGQDPGGESGEPKIAPESPTAGALEAGVSAPRSELDPAH